MGHYKTTKECIVCGIEFLPTSGKQWFCSKKCRNKAHYKRWATKQAIWQKNNQEKVKKYQKISVQKLKNSPEKYKLRCRKSNLKGYYNISVEYYDALFEKQQGVCAICNNPETRVLNNVVVRLSVDHNHKTGKVRKLLCHNCNFKLGVLEDKEFCEKAKKYLEGN